MRSKGTNDGGSFLPSDYVRGKGQARASMFAILLFVLVLAGVIGAFFVNHQRWSRVFEEQQIVAASFKEETAKIEQLKVLEEQRVVLTDKAEIVTALKDRVPRSVLVGELVRGIGSGITLTEIELEGDRVRPPKPKADPKAKKVKSIGVNGVGNGKDAASSAPKVHPPKFKFTISVDGLSENNDDIADYLSSLKASPLLDGVELQFINQTLIDSIEFRKFRITMDLAPYADASMVEGTVAIDMEGNIVETRGSTKVTSDTDSDSESGTESDSITDKKLAEVSEDTQD
ncbi:MAG: PilN domain-containing protein [Phycisphaerales bacterium]